MEIVITIILIGILFFFFGASLGSFFGVLVSRIPRHESIVWPNSHCDSCNTPLKLQDNIPVLSYLSLKGRCRYCGAKIPVKFLVYEVVGGMVGVILGMLVIYLTVKNMSS